MKAHVFREFNYTPSPVTALCSNNTTLVAFRRNKTIDLIDSASLMQFVRYDIEHAVLQCAFLDLNTVIALTEAQKLLVLDIVTLKYEILPFTATNISVRFMAAVYAERTFCYITLRNELFELKNGKTTLITRDASKTSTILYGEHHILVGKENGNIRAFCNGKCISEIEAGAKINKIAQVNNNDFVAVLENGAAILFNIDAGIILDTVEIRNSPLNTVVCTNGAVHISGVDSRIICYNVSTGKFSKITQADYHVSDVICMALDNDRVVTAGEDSVMILNTLTNSRYSHVRVYEDFIKYGTTKNYFYVGNDKSINLFNLESSELSRKSGVANASDGSNRSSGFNTMNVANNKNGAIGLATNVYNTNVMNATTAIAAKNSADIGNNIGIASDINDKITFKISPDVLEKINQKETLFKFFFKFNIDHKLLAIDVSDDEKYLACSTSKETSVYDLFHGSKLKIEKIRTFGPAVQIVFTEKFLIVLEISMQIVLFDLEAFKVAAEIPFENLRERVVCVQNMLVLSNLKRIIDLSNLVEPLVFPVGDLIGQIVPGTDSVTFMTHGADGQRKICSYKDGACLSALEIKETSILHLCSNRVLFDDRTLFVQEGLNLKKYEIGSLINGVLEFGGDLVILHTSWNYLKSKMKPSVFKNKFSN